eukprot:5330766-Prymnesium_polylepis.1
MEVGLTAERVEEAAAPYLEARVVVVVIAEEAERGVDPPAWEMVAGEMAANVGEDVEPFQAATAEVVELGAVAAK